MKANKYDVGLMGDLCPSETGVGDQTSCSGAS